VGSVSQEQDSLSVQEAGAETELTAFRLTGERMALFDAINAQRNSDYGEIGKLPFTLPAEGLPKNFGDAFFLHDSNKPRAVTTVAVTKRVQGLLDDTQTAKKDLDRIFAAERIEAAIESGTAVMELAKKAVDAVQGLADGLKAMKK
jgi:hypothetical protein